MKIKEEIKTLKREIKEIKESLGIKTKLPDDYTGWVVGSAFPKWMVYCVDGVIKYGFNVSGDWFNKSVSVHFSESDRPATREEVETRLKEEAERIGFVKGVMINHNFRDYDGIKYGSILNSGLHFKYGEGDNYLMTDYGECIIFKDGRWAEIIEEPRVNNIAVENLTRETGKEIIRLFKRLGVDTNLLSGCHCKSDGDRFIYYGVFNSEFDSVDLEDCRKNNIKIITLDQLRELAGEKERTFPRMMFVRDEDNQEWEPEIIEFIYNGLAWNFISEEDMVGYKQFKEID